MDDRDGRGSLVARRPVAPSAHLPLGPILVVALGGCALSMLAATLAIRLHIAGYPARLVGLNAAAAAVAAIAVAPLVPAAAVRFGAPRVLGAALLTAAIALAGFAVTASYVTWSALRAVEGGCATVLFVLGEYWITARLSDRWRGVVIGVYVAGVAASFAVGPLLLGVLDPSGPGPFIAGIALFAAAAVVLLAAAPDAPPIAMRRRLALIDCWRAAPALMLAAALHGAIETAGLNLLPVYGGITGPARGAFLTALFIGGAGMLQLPVGIAAGLVGRPRMLRILAAFATLGAVALAVIGVARPLLFAAGLLLWGGVVGSFYPVGLGELPRQFDEKRLVDANAGFVLAYALGTLVGPPLAGEAMDRLPGMGFFLMPAALTLAYLVFALVTRGGHGRPAAQA